jgi:glycosyltransferase involved in cell wall biosynthesis
MTKFTIIIPTRMRADTLLWTLKTCIGQDYENLQIVVSDNASDDNTFEVVKEFNDSRVRYYKTPQRLSMSDNWDFALEKINDGYVCVIGDDDGLAPGAIKNVSAIVEEYKVDAINSKDKAIYFWPGYIEEEFQGCFQLSMNDTFKVVDTNKRFQKSFQNFSSFELPQLYHGFVRTDVIKKLAAPDQRIFKSAIPDIYSSIILGHSLKKHIQSNYPFTIHGLSHHSIGSSYALQHKKSKPAEQFLSEAGELSHKRIVMSPAITTIMADGFLCAGEYIKNFPEADMKKIIYLTIKEARSKPRKELYDIIAEAALQTSRINNLESYAMQVIKENPYNESSSAGFESKLGYMSRSETLSLQSLNFGAKNIHDIFKLMQNFLSDKPEYYYSKPFLEPLPDLLKREFAYIRNLIIRKLKGI